MGVLSLDSLLGLKVSPLTDESEYLVYTMYFDQSREYIESCPTGSSENMASGVLANEDLRRIAREMRAAAETMEAAANRHDQRRFSIERYQAHVVEMTMRALE